MAKIALVTGSSKGIGRGIALGLADAGWDVVVNYFRDQAGGEQTADEVRKKGRQAWVVQADVADQKSVEAMFAFIDAKAGALGALVCNSGVQSWS
ncbi:MAG TPA: SDR family NAD(P)-dependent oxidoreductase, partial [Gemmataceae bacterium]